MKLYSFITTERTANKQGAHDFIRYDLRVGSAAASVQIADIVLKCVKNAQGTMLYSLECDGVQIANGEMPKASRPLVRRIAEVLAIGKQ